MPKAHGKSSATSATRKKHQKKVAAALGIDVDPASAAAKPSQPGKTKNKDKEKSGRGRKEPKVKVYVPPVKPVRAQPDPLDVDGLARRLPPELVVVLRNVGKKAQVTKIRALEELGSGWVERVGEEGEEGGVGVDDVFSLVEMVPAWMHYVPPLFIHPSRRVRLLSISVHANLLNIPEVRDQILFYLRETAKSEEAESILGSWCVLVHDVEKSVGSVGKEAWDSFIRYSQHGSGEETREAGGRFYMLDATPKNLIFNFIQRTIMDPLGVYAYLNPPPASSAPTPPLAAAIAAARRSGTEEGETVRNKAEEYDESETDRRARLKIGGVGGLRWFVEIDAGGISDEVMALLKNPVLWTVLYHAEKAPFVDNARSRGGSGFGDVESSGFGQPNVRKAGWGLLMKLLETHREHIAQVLPVLSSAVLRSAWVEPDTLVHGAMWQPLLTFIKEFPNCWDLESAKVYDVSKAEEEGESDDDEDEDEDEEGEDVHKPEESVVPTVFKRSLAYQEFLQFLQLGCSGSPVQGYPTVMIILSTIPSSVSSVLPFAGNSGINIIASSGTKTPLEDLFTSLWAALDGRALSSLHRVVTSAAFLSAVLECTVFMARRLILDGTGEGGKSALSANRSADVGDEARRLVQAQFGKVWEEMKSGRLKVEERAGARLVGQNLDSLEKIDSGFASRQGGETRLFDAAWSTLKSCLKDAAKSNPGLVATFMKILFDHFKDSTNGKREIEGLFHEILQENVQRVDEVLSTGGGESAKDEIKFLESMLEQFREGLFENQTFAQEFDELTKTHAAFLLDSWPTLVVSYLSHRKNEKKSLDLWHALLNVVASIADDSKMKVASGIVQAAQKGGLPSYLRPRANELDGIIGNLLQSVLAGSTATSARDLEVVKAVLSAHEYFISQSGHINLVETIVNTFNLHVDLLLGHATEDIDLSVFNAPLNLLDLHYRSQRNEGMIEELLPNLFLFGYLVPECAVFGFASSSGEFEIARGIWESAIGGQTSSKEGWERVLGIVKSKLKDLLTDAQVRPLPEDVLRVLAVHGQKLGVSLLHDIFPSPEMLDGTLRRLPHGPIDYSLAVVEPLIPPDVGLSENGPEFTDSQGFSSYARTINALLQVFLEDRNLARQNLWALRHFVALSIYASDYQKVPAGISPVFNVQALASLGELIAKVHQVTTYLLLGSLARAAEGWRRGVVKRIGDRQYGGGSGGSSLEGFMEDVMRVAVESDDVLNTQVLKIILEDILEDVEAEEAEEWVGLARKLESAPQTSMTIIAAVTKTGAEPMRLDRYRNEQAAELLGIRPNKINTDGLLALRRLAASAPDLESDVVFLPQNRAVNVIKACQAWITSDDVDVDEEVESVMTLIFEYLSPILQNVPGSHWEFIWDVLENNLENSSLTDNATLVTLARSLRLVIVIEDLVKTNKSLRTEWEQRRKNVLEMIKGLALVRFDAISPSFPRSICRELILTVLRELPESLMDETTLPKLCHLVTDHSIEVQKMAYRILRTAAQRRTEYLVIEAGVDTESTVEATLPLELLDIVQRHVNLINIEDEDEQQNLFGLLLGWMLVFDLFQDASFKVKSTYVEQMRNSNLIAASFIPLFLAILHLEGGQTKVLKLDVWAVNEFYVDLFELGTPPAIPLLAAHIYYRALLSVPSLIHSWLSDCKDRQLSTTITTYTSQYFSPVIIDVELAHVKGPAGQDLTDENMSVKVAPAVNEVLASYLVDDHQLEIKLKIPSDWPLHKIEVKDVKRVGVDENRWRAWILAVQHKIWSHNGRITDGLSLFKKNVTLHFEGQVECAVCYSIISVTDGSLPSIPCKTCRNKYHAGCLYQWFNTSHSSSCPLCRSGII
ncbi:hypothetical protein P691DRAFT_670660 [Macrolepiota fuliginosa MF-IS2]|uniref:E3 ubiquitin-protein ligase listerin n=1 Tax=Macrolepiota fuliginosa MF-IS2 TaxID=1400762 RepID=A0A9P5XCJ8_9AGAR|nr:hypothetical protein P691DRAFT_670660 [Macrolepiota fuliginosa MF-IS2]